MSEEKIMSKKRFIAGAVCTQCNKADKIVTYVIETSGGSDEVMECVSCGHKQVKSQLVMPQSSPAPSTDASPVKFVKLDPNK